MFAEVLTSAASWNSEQPLLTYSVPHDLQTDLRPGQLVAVPYGDRLVEGIVWHITENIEDGLDGTNNGTGGRLTRSMIRPVSTILDPEPALLPHQRWMAEWMASYYVTPLAQVAFAMLPPGLMQRSKVVLKVVLHLITDEERDKPAAQQQEPPALTSTQALIGLLLADGELDVERLKAMLGPKRSQEVLKEALASGLIEREAQLHAPRTHARHKRMVRLVAQGDILSEWKTRALAQVQEYLPDPTALPMAPDNVRRRPAKPDPWAIPGSSEAFSLTRENQAGLQAQKQLAAVDLLEHDRADASMDMHWTVGILCKASGLSAKQLQKLVRDKIITIEEVEVRRDPLLGLPPGVGCHHRAGETRHRAGAGDRPDRPGHLSFRGPLPRTRSHHSQLALTRGTLRRVAAHTLGQC